MKIKPGLIIAFFLLAATPMTSAQERSYIDVPISLSYDIDDVIERAEELGYGIQIVIEESKCLKPLENGGCKGRDYSDPIYEYINSDANNFFSLRKILVYTPTFTSYIDVQKTITPDSNVVDFSYVVFLNGSQSYMNVLVERSGTDSEIIADIKNELDLLGIQYQEPVTLGPADYTITRSLTEAFGNLGLQENPYALLCLTAIIAGTAAVLILIVKKKG